MNVASQAIFIQCSSFLHIIALGALKFAVHLRVLPQGAINEWVSASSQGQLGGNVRAFVANRVDNSVEGLGQGTVL